jgi:exopolyphosphatase/guanosine-5'-triphosphate,3'-diphosphate pyrophosphatase
LRDGLLLDALDKAGVPEADPDADVRRESVGRLLRRAGADERHALTTVRFALHLFDRTHPLHQLADREREWLEHAARLHDIGWSIGYAGHHRHSAYLITHGGLKGFSADEVSVIAQVARYHRKGRPKATHDAFARLDPWLRPIVEKLSALLRLADALDRTHRQIVTDVEVAVKRRRVVLTLHVSGNPELEVWALQKKSDLFERVFGRRVEAVMSNVVRAGAGEASPGKGRLPPVLLDFPAPQGPS